MVLKFEKIDIIYHGKVYVYRKYVFYLTTDKDFFNKL